jgi:hypothetical protein
MKNFNGYTNYETWMYNLHLTNEGDVMRDYFEQLSSMDAYELGQYLRNEMEERMDEIDLPPIFFDLLNASISEINFQEIAESMLNDYNNEND